DPSDRRAADAARLARAVVDPELVAVSARLVPQRAVHAERRAEARDRLVQHRADLGRDRLPLVSPQRARPAPRIHPRAVQDLARVDVADAGDLLLIEQEVLDAELEVLGSCCERLASWGACDRIGPEWGDRAVAREPLGGDE